MASIYFWVVLVENKDIFGLLRISMASRMFRSEKERKKDGQFCNLDMLPSPGMAETVEFVQLLWLFFQAFAR